MSKTDEFLENNRRYATTYDGHRPARPASGVAIVACMDARMNVHAMLGLDQGDAHVIRNAGGVVTDDVIRSLAISQRLLGTAEILLVHHTDCGMQSITDDGFKASIQSETGLKPAWAVEAFADAAADVRQSIKRITTSPFIPHRSSVRGFIFDTGTGLLAEVS